MVTKKNERTDGQYGTDTHQKFSKAACVSSIVAESMTTFHAINWLRSKYIFFSEQTEEKMKNALSILTSRE